jgi:anthranilate/para-aminobenzoate synthase component I
LSGYSLDDADCCAFNAQREFLSLLQCNGGIVNYQKYVENFECIQEIQRKVFAEKLSFLSEYQLKTFINNNLFRPYFCEWLFVFSPYLDTPSDDLKMEAFYRKYRKHEIELEHSDYDFMKFCEIIDNEIKDGELFPICMSDRMRMLFGDKCSALYHYILENFKD